MELRWFIFAVLCCGLALLVRGFLFVIKSETTADRDHMLNLPKVSSDAESSPDNINPN